jgi:hypothetical protein
LPVPIPFPGLTSSLFRRNAAPSVRSEDGRLGNRRELATVISGEQRQPHVARVLTQFEPLPATTDIDLIDVTPQAAVTRDRNVDRSPSPGQHAHLAHRALQTEIEPEPGLTRIGLRRPNGLQIVIVDGYGRGLVVRTSTAHNLQLRPVNRGAGVTGGQPVQWVAVEGVSGGWDSL